MKNEKGYTVIEFIFTMIILVGIGGWIANIVKIVEMIDGEITAMFIARCVGVFFAPLGAILGFF